jgi:hypothetical protein
MMMRLRRPAALPFVVLMLLAPAGAGAADAVFPEPTELARGSLLVATGATDAAGDSLLVVSGDTDGGPRLLERPGPTAPWGPAMRLRGSVKGPVVAAAGAGAGVMAWRSDRPRRYQSIVALVRDPDVRTWSEPITVSDDDDDGVRHPAVAVNADGYAVLAYNSNTRASHLSLYGAVSVATRNPHATFGTPITVDGIPRAQAPAVAIGPDGRGLVAWIRDRRIWEVDVDAVTGTVGRARPLAPVGRWGSLRVAAGPGATATVVVRGMSGTDLVLYALRRPADGTFARRRFQELDRFRRADYLFVQDIAVAADERGQTTVVWSPESYAGRGFASGVRWARAGEGATAFGRSHDLQPITTLYCPLPTVAAAEGRAAVGWTCSNHRTYRFQTALIGHTTVTGPTTVATGPALPASYSARTMTTATLDATGTTTLFLTRPDPLQPRTSTTNRVLTTTGR